VEVEERWRWWGWLSSSWYYLDAKRRATVKTKVKVRATVKERMRVRATVKLKATERVTRVRGVVTTS
jgi:hypothetical protein